MTYKEYYLKLDSIEEIEKAVKADIAIATTLNPDRIETIRQHAEEAMNEKFGKESEVKNDG